MGGGGYLASDKHFKSNIVPLAPFPNHCSLLNIDDMDYSIGGQVNAKR